VFHHPDRILQELHRICKPGGRVYVTNETMSLINGYPSSDTIRWASQELVEIGRSLGIDLDIGIKTREKLIDTGLEDIRIDVFDINNVNTDCADFAKIVESWEYATAQVATKAGTSAEVSQRIMSGQKDLIRAINDKRGFASWPIYAGSGLKPFRAFGAGGI